MDLNGAPAARRTVTAAVSAAARVARSYGLEAGAPVATYPGPLPALREGTVDLVK